QLQCAPGNLGKGRSPRAAAIKSDDLAVSKDAFAVFKQRANRQGIRVLHGALHHFLRGPLLSHRRCSNKSAQGNALGIHATSRRAPKGRNRLRRSCFALSGRRPFSLITQGVALGWLVVPLRGKCTIAPSPQLSRSEPASPVPRW